MHSAQLHLAATIFWVVMAVPTVLWWHDSVLWVALMSVYAIVVAHSAAYEAAQAKEASSGETSEPTPREAVEE